MTPQEKKEKNKNYYNATKEKRKLEYQNDKETYIKKSKEYREKNKDKIKEQRKKYRSLNKDNLSRYIIERRKNDPLFKLKTNLRSNIANFLKINNNKKLTKTEIILGCSFEDFKIYLESKFENWMNWGNYGLYNGTECYGWDIDHIIPNAKGLTEIEIIQLNNYSNLQPLCSYINRVVKRDNII